MGTPRDGNSYPRRKGENPLRGRNPDPWTQTGEPYSMLVDERNSVESRHGKVADFPPNLPFYSEVQLVSFYQNRRVETPFFWTRILLMEHEEGYCQEDEKLLPRTPYGEQLPS